MKEIGIAIAIALPFFSAIFIAIFLPLVLSGDRWKAAEERARRRRQRDAEMDARLVRLNL